MKIAPVLLIVFLVTIPGFADSKIYTESQHELGVIVVHELAVRDGMLVFRTDSGGCTSAASFTVDITEQDGIRAAVPHYRLTIRRIRADDCKAMLWDGVLIELDLEKDLGITGPCTVSVENPVYQKNGKSS